MPLILVERESVKTQASRCKEKVTLSFNMNMARALHDVICLLVIIIVTFQTLPVVWCKLDDSILGKC